MTGLLAALVVVFALAMPITVPAPAAARSCGAIGWSARTGRWGSAFDYGARAGVVRGARRACGPHSCGTRTWFRDACGALVTAPGGGWSASWANTIRQARRRALRRCRAEGHRGCRVRVPRGSWR